MSRYLTVAAVAAALAAQPVAAATFFDNEAAYTAAATTEVTDDFESYGSISGTTTLVLNEFTATEDPGQPGVAILGGSTFGFGVTSGSFGLVYDDNSPTTDSIVTWDAFSSSYTAMGFFMATSEDSSVDISGSVSTTFDLVANTPTFFGVIDTAPITSLVFDVTGGPNVVFDDFRAGQGQTPVIPLPASVLLLGAGLASLTGLRRFSRKV